MEHRIFNEYSSNIRRLKTQCVNAGMTEDEFRELYFESLQTISKNKQTRSYFKEINRRHIILIIGIIVLMAFIYNIKTVYSCVICNLQELIYPIMKMLRKISIPVISLFPSLTELYHETCLIQNPFFTVVDMDCWPCSTVHNVREIYDPRPMNQQHGVPFTYETEQQVVTLITLKDLYLKNKEVFDKETPKILTNNKYYLKPFEMFNNQVEKCLFIWKFNNLSVARILRQIIPRPKVVPKFGQSTERYIIIDTSHESFQIPDTECSFSFVLSLSGTRTIDLKPAEECKHQCKTLKVELKEHYLLWYNWWYWRPVVQSSHSNVTLIAHVGSYC